MKAVHAGAASRPPCASAMIFFGLSKPIHTPASRSAVYPMNQTLVPSLVVPVLPPAGRRNPELQMLAAVPRRSTSFIMSTMIHASSGERTVLREGVCCHSTSCRAFSTRRIALVFGFIP